MGKFIGIRAGAVVEKDGQVVGVGCLVQVEGKRRRATPFEVDGKKTYSNRGKQANATAGERMDNKGGKRQSVRWKAWRQQSNIKCAVSEEHASCWVQQDCQVVDEKKVALKKTTGVSGRKDKYQMRLKGRKRD